MAFIKLLYSEQNYGISFSRNDTCFATNRLGQFRNLRGQSLFNSAPKCSLPRQPLSNRTLLYFYDNDIVVVVVHFFFLFFWLSLASDFCSQLTAVEHDLPFCCCSLSSYDVFFLLSMVVQSGYLR